jgi:hypothetical protein
MFTSSQKLSPYQRRNDQGQQDPVFLPSFPVQDIVRVVGRLRDQDSFAVAGEFDVLCACIRNDAEVSMPFTHGFIAVFASLRRFDRLFEVGGVLFV